MTTHKLSFLFVCTEWYSYHGGLPTFNRELCIALAQAGHDVQCFVPSFTNDEHDDAEIHKVTLLSSVDVPGLKNCCSLVLEPAVKNVPNIIIGHDRHTGSQACYLRQRFFPDAQLIVFIHTSPREIEVYKNSKGAAERAEQRCKQQAAIAESANLVVAVGPRLFEEVQMMKIEGTTKIREVHRFDPGLYSSVTPISDERPIKEILLLGRAEDLELKGLDIAAESMAKLLPLYQSTRAPRLVIRGAEPGTADDLREMLSSKHKVPADLVIVKDYTHDRTKLDADLKRASLLIMPSRVEGFGLVGLEAIAAEVPILISSRSGLADLLKEQIGNQSYRFVVPIEQSLKDNAKTWSVRLQSALAEQVDSRTQATVLRSLLEPKLTWSTAVDLLMTKIQSLQM